jgi:hypothetical protein
MFPEDGTRASHIFLVSLDRTSSRDSGFDVWHARVDAEMQIHNVLSPERTGVLTL